MLSGFDGQIDSPAELLVIGRGNGGDMALADYLTLMSK